MELMLLTNQVKAVLVDPSVSARTGKQGCFGLKFIVWGGGMR